MKVIKRLAAVVLAITVIFAAVACGDTGNKGGGTGGDKNTGNNLTPSNITLLADIPNCAEKVTLYKPSAVVYSAADTAESKESLDKRIAKKQEEDNSDASSVVKIFINSTSEGIINAMSEAAVPTDKMKKTVAYMAGETDVTNADISSKVASGNWSETNGWSFFDDWEYYDQLKKEADIKKPDKSTDDRDDDNVKRQYRNMAGKIFALDLTNDQFARLMVYELAYAIDIVESSKMANATISSGSTLNKFDEYCKDELDYETLVYLRAFNQYYNDGQNGGLANSVELFAYYYGYNRTSYYAQSNQEFEDELKYSHMEKFTDEDWLDYVKIQRNSYEKAYRYSDKFYRVYYNKHLSFQSISEQQELYVYSDNGQSMSKWGGKSYTEEMSNAIRNNGLEGQLNMTDWLWCYGGDTAAMKEYNAANTLYVDGKNQTNDETKARGEYAQNMQHLKVIAYLLEKMGKTNLGNALYFEVYSYSSNVVQTAQGMRKNIILINDEKKNPEDVTCLINGLNTDKEKQDYAKGKLNVLLGQLNSNYRAVGVDSKASGASGVDWEKITKEINESRDEKLYANDDTYRAKVERMEKQVIKKVWSCCGAAVGDPVCSKNPAGHMDGVEEYDNSWQTSVFVHNYQDILRYMAGQAVISFQKPTDTTTIIIPEYNGLPRTWTTGYKGSLGEAIATYKAQQKDVLSELKYEDLKSIELKTGDTFNNNADESDINWYTGTNTETKDSQTRNENANGTYRDYKYTYSNPIWYLDSDFKYVFNPDDEINFNLTLYLGFDIKKEVK